MNELGYVLEHYVLVSTVIFTLGAIGFLARRNVLVQLMSIELMLNAVNLALVAFNRVHGGDMNGHVFAFFIIAVAAAEAAVGLAIVLSFYRLRNTVNSDAADTLRHWDAFVSASRSEAFPLAVLEAMAHGLPVVATAVGGVPEQIRDGETGLLVPPDDPDAIARALIRLHDDAGLRSRLGSAAAAQVRSERTLARQAGGLHGAYLTALNRRFGPPRIRRAA